MPASLVKGMHHAVLRMTSWCMPSFLAAAATSEPGARLLSASSSVAVQPLRTQTLFAYLHNLQVERRGLGLSE